MEYLDFLRFYKLSMCFHNLASYDALANTNEINAGFRTCFPPMQFYPSEIEDIQFVQELRLKLDDSVPFC